MKETIKVLIDDFVNTFSKESRTGWKKPLVTFAGADDPLFVKLKEVASPTHAQPVDFLTEAKTVITYFIPFKDEVALSNKAGRFSSREWAVAYVETNQLINDLNRYLQESLVSMGQKAAFVPATHNFNEKTLLSDWSHRHAAYIAGLGTFGLNHMLITEQGCCGRIGSLITDLAVEPTLRYRQELCLYKTGGTRGSCVKKCVNNALKIEGLDRQNCYRMCLQNGERFSELEGITDVCGKCMVGVPCSISAPEINSDN